MNFYNDNNPECVRWLKEQIALRLIPDGVVDERSIRDISPTELEGYQQCHFFAGVGGWPYALELAGWPKEFPVWTGSCPCQPLSNAGMGRGDQDIRHLWPEFARLISQRLPPTVFGEQVAGDLGQEWLCAIRADFQTLGYGFAASGLSGYIVNSPQERLRSYWVANSTINGCKGLQRSPEAQVQKDWSLKALDAWHGTGNPFEEWQKLLAQSDVRRVADGVSSEVDIRPRLRAYGNSIIPQVAAVFIRASLEAFSDTEDHRD